MLRLLVTRGLPGPVLAVIGAVISIACVAWLLTVGFVWLVDQAIDPGATATARATPLATPSAAAAPAAAPCVPTATGDAASQVAQATHGTQAAQTAQTAPAAAAPAPAAGATPSAPAVVSAAPKKPAVATVRRKPRASVLSRMLAPGRFAYHEIVRDAAERHRVEMKLVMAIIASESGGDPNAVSPAGAVGLMQLMPETAARLGVEDPFDPEQNVDGAVRYLKSLLSTFKSVDLSLIAYNAGPGFAIRYRKGHVELGAETRNFLMRVGDLLQ